MNILIVGAGKVGSYLARVLENSGDEVSIVDESEEALMSLEDFAGLRIQGIAIDVDVLKSAGIENCDAVAAVTNNDNVNLMVSQIAQNIFNVPKVLCRVYDPARKDVFNTNFSISTFCPTSVTVGGVVSYLKFDETPSILQFGSTTAAFKHIKVTEDMDGKSSNIIKQDDFYRILGIIGANKKMSLYTGEVTLHKGDSVVLCEIDR